MILPERFVFLRHAEALSLAEFGGPDAQRPLTAKGTRRAHQICRGLVSLYRPTRILASPYVRAVETARLLAHALSEHGMAIETSDALAPDGNFEGWKTFLRGLTPALAAADTVAVVGHEPSLGTFFARHLGMRTPVPFKKAGVGVLAPSTLDKGDLVAFLPPRVWLRT